MLFIFRANEADVKIVVIDLAGQDLKTGINTVHFLSNYFTKLGLKSLLEESDHDITVVADEETPDGIFENQVKDFTNTIIVFNKIDVAGTSNISEVFKIFGNRILTNKINLDNQNITTVNETHMDISTCEHCNTNKRKDINAKSDDRRWIIGEERSTAVCLISCVTGEGMDKFVETLKDMVAEM